MLTKAELEVIATTIFAVETGGQVYGKGAWDDFTEAYANCSNEHAITIGAGGWYANEAKKLLLNIYKADPATFKKLDKSGVYNDLSRDWSRYKINKFTTKAKNIKAIISTPIGIQCQKELLGEQMQVYAKEAEKLGVTDHQGQAECANFRHQGGYYAMKRVIAKTKKPYNLDNLYAAVCTDTKKNQIGTYKQRQKVVYNCLKKYWPSENTVKAVKEPEPLNKKVIRTAKLTQDISPRTWAGNETDMINLKMYQFLKKGEEVGICDTVKASDKSDWYYILIDGKHYGFIPATAVAPVTEKAVSENTTDKKSGGLSTTPKWVGVVTAGKLNVRTWAGTSNPNLKSYPTLKKGTKVEVCDIVNESSTSKWYYVRIAGKVYGFVSAKYIKNA